MHKEKNRNQISGRHYSFWYYMALIIKLLIHKQARFKEWALKNTAEHKSQNHSVIIA